MKSKRIIFLIVLLVASLVYAFSSMLVEPEHNPEHNLVQHNQVNQLLTPKADIKHHQQNKTLPNVSNPIKPKSTMDMNGPNKNKGLPIAFLLVGIQQKTNEQDAKVILQANGELFEYALFDTLLDTDMQLVNIFESSVEVEYNAATYKVALTPPNILTSRSDTNEERYSDLIEMTPKEIGSRPRIIEHLMILIPTPYIADAQLVKPGLNPALFAKAGFQEDDLLKTINGKSVTIEEELEAIKEELKTAHTLEFEVMRKGRLVTLYLDIPSEALEIKAY